MVVWLVSRIGGLKMPLPQSCPMEFACMPEHFVEDIMELLIFASRIPRALDGVKLVKIDYSFLTLYCAFVRTIFMFLMQFIGLYMAG